MGGAPIAEEGTYQNKPSMTLKWRADSKYPFNFGLTNARLILACLPQIQAFVDRHPEESTGARKGTYQRQSEKPAPVETAYDNWEPSRGQPRHPAYTETKTDSSKRPC